MDNTMIEWIMAGGVLTIAGFSVATYKYVGQVKDATFKYIDKVKDEALKHVEQIKIDTDIKINRNYERLDEIKDNFPKEYTRKELCNLLHKQITTDLTEIKTDVKLLLRKNEIKKDGQSS